MFTAKRVGKLQYGLLFKNGEFERILETGNHRFLNWNHQHDIDVVSKLTPWIEHPHLDQMIQSGQLEGRAEVIKLADNERAIVWIDNRFDRILEPGTYAYWIGSKEVVVERMDTSNAQFEHEKMKSIAQFDSAKRALRFYVIGANDRGVLFFDGKFSKVLEPGTFAFWPDANANIVFVDMREKQLEVSGQEIMTADKVSLRLNAMVAYKVVDPRQCVTASVDEETALYRQAQLALRAAIGTRDLDEFLADKDDIVKELSASIHSASAKLGLEVTSFGIRDVILPGDMKDLMNKVTEAKKAAEANLIFRREEVAAMRSQANTAKLLNDNPTLMRLRELEVLEKLVENGKMNIVLGEKGLAERVMNLL